MSREFFEILMEYEDFGALVKQGKKWAAARKGEVLDTKKDFIHDTPEEAIKSLYANTKS